MLTLLVRSSAAWTAFGLASGLYYREVTKHFGLAGTRELAGTQLSVVHTHVLALGTIVLLVLLALVAQFRSLEFDRRFRWGVWAWQAGLGITSVGMLVKGTLQASNTAGFDAPALAGLAGLGHLILTLAFILLFLGMHSAVQGMDRNGAEKLPAG